MLFSFAAQPNATSIDPFIIPGGGTVELVRVPQTSRLILALRTLSGELRAQTSTQDVVIGTLETYPWGWFQPAAGLTGIVVEAGATLYLRNPTPDPVSVTGNLLGYFAPL